MERIPHWIDGRAADGGDGLEVHDPATGAAVAEVGLADGPIVDRAVTAAAEAFGAWRDTPPMRRAELMYAFRDRLLDASEELARQITTEHGKTLDEARGEVARGITSVELACGAPALLKGEMSEQVGRGVDTYSTLHPLGVCLGVTPSNFPVMVPLVMLSVAVAAGNAFVLKPSEQDPGPAVRLAELATEAGLPDGILSVVNGDRDTVTALIDHPAVAAVSFVGSTPAAHSVYVRAAQAGIRAQAFGGAKNHMVVMPDARLEAAAEALTSAAFGSAGQRCMAITTAVAVGEAADRLVEHLGRRADDIMIGPGDDPASEMGPLISVEAQQRVRGLVERAVAAGARPVVDRSFEIVPGHEDGAFVGPVVLDEVAADMEIYRTEVFGPVLSVVRVDSLDDAIELVRVNEYGNGGSIYTRSGLSARRFQRDAAVGMVGVNVPVPVPVASHPFAGWKQSAFGDTGLNNDGWRFFTRAKYVTARWNEAVAGDDPDLG